MRLDDATAFAMARGVRGQALSGARVTINRASVDPHTAMPEHAHDHEQLGYVLDGRAELVIDGVAHVLGPGDAYVVPSGVRHFARTADEGCVMLDVFAPVREDFRSAQAAADADRPSPEGEDPQCP